ncbi:MAG: hypothetical protein Rubg2KO_02130 [Rubricoccaceae bacterium]
MFVGEGVWAMERPSVCSCTTTHSQLLTAPFVTRFLLLAALAFSIPCAAQSDLLRASVDCPGRVSGCDRDFFQTEIPFVQFVRDQADSDVFVLIVEEDTGGGGGRYTVLFEGRRGDALGRRDTLQASVPPGASDDDERRALLSRLQVGLAGFALETNAGPRISVTYDAPTEAEEEAEETVVDPWNSWVFRLRGNGFFQGQSRSQSMNTFASLQASRVTEDLKVSVRPNVSYNRSSFELSDGSEFVSDNVSYGLFSRAVKSLSAHTSAGLSASASRQTFSNYDLRARVAPAVEYNLYPYSEATQRQLRFSYEVGGEFAAYADTTIFLKTSETLPFHEVGLAAEFKQPWGSLDVFSGVSQYLSQPDKYNASIGGNVNFRLFRGFNLNVSGSYSLVRDQINLPADDASDGEVLTQQQELATGFNYFAQVGFSYSFGSIYNQVVNARFGN